VPRAVGRQANGYVLNVAPARRETLLRDEWPAEPVGDFKHSRSHPLICFVGFADGAITHLALGRRGVRAGTGLRRLNLEELTPLGASLSHASIVARVPARVRAHVQERLTAGGVLPPGSFGAVVEAVRSLLPQSNSLLDRFSERRRQRIAALSDRARRSLAYQKETVATALALADLDVEELQDWSPGVEVASFLDGLPQARLREDQMLLNDFRSFPGFDLIRTMQHGAAVFSKDGVRLTVVMANRHALEEQTGADLIYRNESFGSFVFVQYKAMEHEADRAVFRLPNEQLAKELARMTALSKQLDDCEPEFALGGFRLMANPFFLKLCPRLTFDPDDTGLTKGMYIPLEYWRRLETDPCIEGARGGRGITYENVGRYFANTDFVSLVARGWVGTAGMQTQILDEVIREAVASGRAVTIAVKKQLPRPSDEDDAEDDDLTDALEAEPADEGL